MTTSNRGGGHNKKSIAEHKQDGTYRSDRHGVDADLAKVFREKPPHRELAERERCPVPVEWERRWKSRGVWTPNDDLAIEWGCWFEEDHAEHFRLFCRECLSLWEGKQWAGKPFEFMDWQWYDVFAPLFGWMRWNPEAREGAGAVERRFDRAFIFVPKKQGKSPMAAAVGGYFLSADGETGGKVLSAASAKEQAAIVHGHALNMIRASELLAPRCKINESTHAVTFEHPTIFKHAPEITRTPANNVYKSISAEARTAEGQNANCILADEVHAWRGRKLYDAIEYAFEARESPLFFMITTSGDDEQTVCFEQYEYAKDVASGHIQDIGFLSYIRAADKEDNLDDPATWHKANPSMGVTITETRFREMWEKAKKTSNAAVSSFKRYRFNIWGTVADPMLDPDAWDACYETYTAESMFGRVAYGGLDLSKSMDMTAFCLMFPDNDEVRQLCWFWLPEEMFERNKGRVPYQDWVDEGWLEICPGGALDYDVVAKRIIWAAKEFRLTSVRFDPWKGQVVVPELIKAGIQCAEFPQQPKYFADPSTEYQAMVLKASLRHNGNGCLTWQSRHVKGKTDINNNIRPVKGERGGIRAIDGIIAGIMALDGKMREPVPSESYYATHELEVG